MNPVKFRPEHDPRYAGEVDWADNRLSNFLAWASRHLTPNWCHTPEHWTSHVAQYLFTDCPCCAIFRGVMVGAVVFALPFALIVTPLFVWLLR